MKKNILIIGGVLAIAVAIFGFRFKTSHYKRSITSHLELPIREEVTQRDATRNESQIQIALILDTSGSMDGLLDQAKSQLWNIINELARAEKDSTQAAISIALYEYGNDNISVRQGYVRQVLPFTADLDLLSEKLFALSTNGGSEYCGKAIRTSLKELEWSANDESMKAIYIAGNEPFNQGTFSHQEACQMASQKGVTVFPIFCGDMAEGQRTHWGDCAQLTAGQFMNIDSDVKVVHVATPYDDQINQLNYQLNNTYIYYGNDGRRMKSNQLRQDENQAKYSKMNSVSRALSKSSNIYMNSNWDLLDAYNADTTVITSIDKETLPDSLQEMNTIELKNVVLEKQQEREKIKNEIAKLGVERANYIADNNTSANEVTLGEKMVNTIKIEAKKKGYVFN